MKPFQKNALLSVFNKEGIVEFGASLVARGIYLWGSSGTTRTLREAGLEVADIADIVGPPIFGHRVVTLSREVHGGLLSRDIPADLDTRRELNIPWFEILYVNLYPIEQKIREGASEEAVIESTDIGGPAMLRSAAKSRRLVLCEPWQCAELLKRLDESTADEPTYRRKLAYLAELRVAQYCMASAEYMKSLLEA